MLANGNGVQGSYSDDDAAKFLEYYGDCFEWKWKQKPCGWQNENSMVFLWKQCMPSRIIRFDEGKGILPSMREFAMSPLHFNCACAHTWYCFMHVNTKWKMLFEKQKI